MAKRQERPTEKENPASRFLDALPTGDILRLINREDRQVAPAVARQIPQIARAVGLIVDALQNGGRLVYVGTGTSGRLGVVDAAECIPTFGTTRVIGVMAGAPKAMFRASEGLEDDPRCAGGDMRQHGINRKDVVVGISASGETAYTVAALRWARARGARTVAVTANPRGTIRRMVDVAIVPQVGPEVIAGSTRMKAGTSQKMVLNMLSTGSMVRWSRVLGNRMIHMRLGSRKLIERGWSILRKTTGVSNSAARRALEESGNNLPLALIMLSQGISREKARAELDSSSAQEVLREVIPKAGVRKASRSPSSVARRRIMKRRGS